jgi:hypothetical protein
VSPQIKSKLAESSDRVKAFMMKDRSYIDLAAIKTARDELAATIAKFPFTRIASATSSSLLKSIYSGFVAQADGIPKKILDTTTYDSAPPPADVLFAELCQNFQQSIWTFEDAYRENEECAVREITAAPSLASHYFGHTEGLDRVEDQATGNITANSRVYLTMGTVGATFLKDENSRLKKCYQATNTCAEALVS